MIGTSLPAQGESVSPRETLRTWGESRRDRDLRHFRDPAMTLTAPTPGAVVRTWRSTARCYLPLLCSSFLGVCCTLKPGVYRLSQVIRRAMRVYVGLQICHPGFEFLRRLWLHQIV